MRPRTLSLVAATLAAVVAAAAALAGDGDAPAPIVVCDFAAEPDTAAGEPIAKWMAARAPDWHAEFGTPSFFSIRDGALRLVARRGPLAR